MALSTPEICLIKPMHSLVLATQDPEAFRSILLLAAVHHSWKTGALHHFEATYLFHKIECIRAINQYLSNTARYVSTACIKAVATLCITEVSCDGSTSAIVYLLTHPRFSEQSRQSRRSRGSP